MWLCHLSDISILVPPLPRGTASSRPLCGISYQQKQAVHLLSSVNKNSLLLFLPCEQWCLGVAALFSPLNSSRIGPARSSSWWEDSRAVTFSFNICSNTSINSFCCCVSLLKSSLWIIDFFLARLSLLDSANECPLRVTAKTSRYLSFCLIFCLRSSIFSSQFVAFCINHLPAFVMTYCLPFPSFHKSQPTFVLLHSCFGIYCVFYFLLHMPIQSLWKFEQRKFPILILLSHKWLSSAFHSQCRIVQKNSHFLSLVKDWAVLSIFPLDLSSAFLFSHSFMCWCSLPGEACS